MNPSIVDAEKTSLARQQGWAVLLFILVMGLITLLALNLLGKKPGTEAKLAQGVNVLQALETAKRRLLTHAMLSPELYVSRDNSGTVDYYSMKRMGGLGFLPCPDFNSDGAPDSTCGNPRVITYAGGVYSHDKTTGITNNKLSGTIKTGLLPHAIVSRNFYIYPQKFSFYYVVDERFTIFNNRYDVNSAESSVNTTLISAADKYVTRPPVSSVMDIQEWLSTGAKDYLLAKNESNNYHTLFTTSGVSATPYLLNSASKADQNILLPYLNIDLNDPNENRANERNSYVAVIIWPGPDGKLAPENADGDDTFANSGDDIVVGISFREWKQAMRDRLCSERAYYTDFLGASTSGKHWILPYNSALNPIGQNWRSVLVDVHAQAEYGTSNAELCK
ncbi:hypothetical protein [Sulfurivirga sp.]|uniref:hypothetical protein n=1 Tax=Sulfurivirga sp. TaxID=2614236 RepID=UPI00260120CE|nr:hypothetical protein [Sulfurivirga sp.]